MFSVLSFLRQWWWLLLAATATFAVTAALLAYAKPVYRSQMMLETQRVRPDVLRDPKTIDLALVAIFSQAELTKLFATEFFQLLDDVGKRDDAKGQRARDARQVFSKALSVKLDDKMSPEEASVLGFASYLGGPMLDRLRRPKEDPPLNGFHYMIRAADGYSMSVILQSDTRSIAPAVTRATFRGLNAVIARYNAVETKRLKDLIALRVKNAEEVFSDSADEYMAIRSSLGLERSKLTFDFFKLERDVSKIERDANISYKVTSSGVGSETFGVDSAQASLLLNVASGIDTTFILDSFEVASIARRIAYLAAVKGIDQSTLDQYVARLNEIDTMRSELLAKMSAPEHTFVGAQNALTAALTTATLMPVGATPGAGVGAGVGGDFMLALTSYDENSLLAQARTNADRGQDKRILMNTFVGGVVGMTVGVLIALLFRLFPSLTLSLSSLVNKTPLRRST